MRIRCTACSAVLNVADEVAGKRIRCPRCKEAIVAAPAKEEKRKPQTAASPSKSIERLPKADDIEESEDMPRPRKKKKKRKKDKSQMIVGIAVTGVVAVGIAIAVVVLANTRATAPAAAVTPAVAEGVAPVPFIIIPSPRIDPPDVPAAQHVRKAETPVRRVPSAPPRIKVDVVPSYFKLPQGSEETWLAQGREDLKAMHRTLRDAYEKVGHRDPKWDKQASLALELAAGMFAQRQERTERANDVYEPVLRAIAAGCDDPMILYLHARTYGGKERYLPQAELVARHAKAAEALRDSKYSPFRRAVGLQMGGHLLWFTNSPEQREQSKAMLSDALDAFVASVKEERDDPAIRRQLLSVGEDLVKSLGMTEGTALAGWKKVNDALANVPNSEAFRLKLRGGFLTAFAWRSQGEAPSSTVSDEAARSFRDRLEDARGCFERAWQLDSGDIYVPVRMIAVAKGLGAEKEEVRKWFDRAMKLDPACYDACEAVVSYLDPRWHGSMEKVVAFGRECARSKLVGSHIPLLLLQAHVRSVVLQQPDIRRESLASDAVWHEVFDICKRNLDAYPDDYAVSAALEVFLFSAPERGPEARDSLDRAADGAPQLRAMMEMERGGISVRSQVNRVCPSR